MDGAAYQGHGWRPRVGDLAGELRDGRWWRRAGMTTEWDVLRTAMIGLPAADWPDPVDWNAVQFLQPVDFGALRRELSCYGEVLRDAGVEVLYRELAPVRSGFVAYNSCFVRDQFLMTPEGAVVARMASVPRAGEEAGITADLAAAGVPILATIGGSATFEGADALWLGPTTVLVGVGNRTNASGALQLRDILGRLGVKTLEVAVPQGIQHLLGVVQLVDHDLAVVRTSRVDGHLARTLAEAGFRLIDFPESPGVTRGQAMNFVALGPRRILMIGGAPQERDRLVDAGLEVLTAPECPQLLLAAGGLACATGIILRADAGG